MKYLFTALLAMGSLNAFACDTTATAESYIVDILGQGGVFTPAAPQKSCMEGRFNVCEDEVFFTYTLLGDTYAGHVVANTGNCAINDSGFGRLGR